MSLVDNWNRAADRTRALRGKMDPKLRPFSVIRRIRQWSGARAGLGTMTDVDLPLLVAGENPEVRQLSQRDVIASGGLYTTQDFQVVLTPFYSTPSGSGGYTVEDLDPPPGAQPREIFFRLTGPGFPQGAWFKKVGLDVSQSLTYVLFLRKTAEVL